MNDSGAVLQANSVCKTFTDSGVDITVLNELDLLVKPGEQLAIIGPSGTGKSTLLHILGGLDYPSRGEMLVKGQSMHTMNERARSLWRNQHLGFVYQFHHLLPEFSALENVAMPLLLGATSVKTAKQQAQTLLTEMGLAKRLDHRLSQLSGGERQRVAIARALVNQPACVLADEPTGNLDPHTAKAVYEKMLLLNREKNTALVIVTHDRLLAEKMDRILTLHEGKLINVNDV